MANPLAAVTGASSGIGFNLAKVFAEHGFDLVIASSGPRLQPATVEIRTKGVEVTPVEADLATFDGVEEFWRRVEDVGRPIEAVAINAGVGVGGLFAESELAREINLIRLNVEGTVHLAKLAVKRMTQQGRGRILITSSIAAEMVAPREAVYGASKAFELSFAKSLRAELEGSGITVTTLQPGAIDTDFFRRAGMQDTELGQQGKKEPPPYEVAKQGFEALMKGEKHVYAASLKTKLEGALANLIPDSVKAAVHEKIAKPKGPEEKPAPPHRKDAA